MRHSPAAALDLKSGTIQLQLPLWVSLSVWLRLGFLSFDAMPMRLERRAFGAMPSAMSEYNTTDANWLWLCQLFRSSILIAAA